VLSGGTYAPLQLFAGSDRRDDARRVGSHELHRRIEQFIAATRAGRAEWTERNSADAGVNIHAVR
jgi:hypothetical protein